MQKHHRMRPTIWAVALLVLITGMSCSLVTGGIQNQPEAVQNPPAAEAGEYIIPHAPTLEGTLDIDIGLEQFNSYRGRLLIDFTADSSPPASAMPTSTCSLNETAPRMPTTKNRACSPTATCPR